MPCRSCGSPLAADQRYCLACGSRNGPPRLDWRAMVTPPAELAAEHDDGVGPGLPSPRVAAALVLGVLAFGVVVGHAAGPGAPAADAGGRPNLTIVTAAPAAPVPVTPVAPATTPAPPADEGTADLGADGSTDVADGGGADDEAADDKGATTDDASSPDRSSTTDDSSATNDTAPAASDLPPVKHVWVVALTGHYYAETFGAG